MGVSISHNAYNGSCGSFNQLRYWLANRIGINLKDDYIGYGSDNATKKLESIDHKLKPLFNHSDCDGILTPSECKQIAEGIEEILNKISKEEAEHPENNWQYSYYNRAKQFKDGCLKAFNNNENIEFY